MDLSLLQDLYAERIGSFFGLSPEAASAVAAALSIVSLFVIAIIVDGILRTSTW